MKLKSRVLWLAVALMLTVGSLFDTVVFALDENLPVDHNVQSTVTWSFQTIDGRTVTDQTYQGKVQILVIYNAKIDPSGACCYNSKATVSGLSQAEWIRNDNVQVITIGNGTLFEAQAFKQAFAPDCDDMDFCYADDFEMWSLVDSFDGLIGEHSSSLTYAVNYVIDENNMFRYTWQGDYNESYYTKLLNTGSGSETEPTDTPIAPPDYDSDAYFWLDADIDYSKNVLTLSIYGDANYTLNGESYTEMYEASFKIDTPDSYKYLTYKGMDYAGFNGSIWGSTPPGMPWTFTVSSNGYGLPEGKIFEVYYNIACYEDTSFVFTIETSDVLAMDGETLLSSTSNGTSIKYEADPDITPPPTDAPTTEPPTTIDPPAHSTDTLFWLEADMDQEEDLITLKIFMDADYYLDSKHYDSISTGFLTINFPSEYTDLLRTLSFNNKCATDNTWVSGNRITFDIVPFNDTIPSGQILEFTFGIYSNVDTNLVFSIEPDGIFAADGETLLSSEGRGITLQYQGGDPETTPPVNRPPENRGDVNQSGAIDSGDATLVLRSVIGAFSLNEKQSLSADININGNVDAGDATMILRIVVGSAILMPWDYNAQYSKAWSLHQIDGNTVTEKTYSNKIQIIVLFDPTLTGGSAASSESAKTISSLSRTNWITEEGIQVIAIGMGTQEEVAAFKNKYAPGCDDIVFCYAAEDEFMRLVRSFRTLTGDGSDSVEYTTNYVLDVNNIFRYTWDGDYFDRCYTEVLLELDPTLNTYKTRVSGTADYAQAYEQFELLNKHRVNNGLSPLVMDKYLLEAAMQRAAEISVYFSHTRPNGKTCFTVPVDGGMHASGENIAVAYWSAESVTEGWINSPGHNANMLEPSYNSVGVGCFMDENGTLHWVQLFSYSEGTAESVRSTSKKAVFDIVMNDRAISLKASPSSLGLSVGKSETITLCNANVEFGGSLPQIYITLAVSSNENIASISIQPDGTAKITAKAQGTVSFTVGLYSALSTDSYARFKSVTITLNITG